MQDIRTKEKLTIYIVESEHTVKELRKKVVDSFYSILEKLKKQNEVNIEELISKSPIPKENEVFISIQKLPKVVKLFSILEKIEK